MTSDKKMYYKNLLVRKDTKGRYVVSGGKKKRLPKGARATSKKTVKKASPAKRKPKPKGYYSKKYIKSPLRKKVYSTPKDKRKSKKEIGKRLSARAVYNEHGNKAVGKTYNVLQPSGEYVTKYLRLRKNGSPYFTTKFGHTHFGKMCFG